MVSTDLQIALDRIRELDQYKEAAMRVALTSEADIIALKQASAVDKAEIEELKNVLDATQRAGRSMLADLAESQAECERLTLELRAAREASLIPVVRQDFLAPALAQACSDLEAIAAEVLQRHQP